MEKEIIVCPKCGSTHIGINVTGGGNYEFCQDCGYGQPAGLDIRNALRGHFPTIKKSELKKFQEQIKKKQKSK